MIPSELVASSTHGPPASRATPDGVGRRTADRAALAARAPDSARVSARARASLAHVLQSNARIDFGRVRGGEKAMRRHLTSIAALAALGVLTFAPLGASADDDARLEALEERLMALEDEIEARDATIDAQRDLLARQEPHVGQGSGIDEFFSTLEVGGYVSASYIYNFNRTPVASRFEDGITQPLCQFNCRQNEFSLDAAKLNLGRPASNPGDAGFQLDLLLGQNADILRSLSPDSDGDGSFGADDFSLFVQQAYVAYNWRGVEFKAGKFETLLGWELLDQPLNYNITQGILFTWAIPLYHTGVLASGQLTEEVGWALGLTNGFNNTLEGNDNKAGELQAAGERDPVAERGLRHPAGGGGPRRSERPVRAEGQRWLVLGGCHRRQLRRDRADQPRGAWGVLPRPQEHARDHAVPGVPVEPQRRRHADEPDGYAQVPGHGQPDPGERAALRPRRQRLQPLQ
jgi:hypothetical protein